MAARVESSGRAAEPIGLRPMLRQLADGRFHSGQALAEHFGVTRSAVWKQVARLERFGLAVEAVRGKGYRLTRPLDLLDTEAIIRRLPAAAAARIEALEVATEIDSTNARLLAAPAPSAGSMSVRLAEYQHAGRGRRGRSWTAPLASGLCLSVGWLFAETPPDLAALPLAVGVVVRRVVAGLCGVKIGLKWPNDLIWDGRKLGGILVELAGEPQGRCYVVAGIGVNVSLPDSLLAQVSDWPQGAVDLERAAGEAPRRDALAAGVIAALAEAFGCYAADGFAPLRAEFEAADVLCGRRVEVADAERRIAGTACGIAADGALLVEVDGERRRVISGDVSVRTADA